MVFIICGAISGWVISYILEKDGWLGIVVGSFCGFIISAFFREFI